MISECDVVKAVDLDGGTLLAGGSFKGFENSVEPPTTYSCLEAAVLPQNSEVEACADPCQCRCSATNPPPEQAETLSPISKVLTPIKIFVKTLAPIFPI